MPNSGGGVPTSNMLNDRLITLQSYLQDLIMIPAIKESNQLKNFLGIREHYPEFYNPSMDEMNSVQDSKQFFSINLKDFTMQDKGAAAKNELLKFITASNKKDKSPLKQHTATKSNLRY